MDHTEEKSPGPEAPPFLRKLIEKHDNWPMRGASHACAVCMWFVPKKPALGSERTAPLGRCRRHAPTMSGFPAVYESDWCGDHKLA